eukprot:Rhum_TRINITY_DN10860_c0_g1::Rhum_TRINITY_DN10860_c0_g1_i1::g.40754::m.40754/K03773/fklB; FKBP-type peptidyl-prolyl cis-trans isomerase FklB
MRVLPTLVAACCLSAACALTRDEGEKFLEEKATQKNVFKLPSGMLVKVLSRGTGDKSPNHNDPCSVHYKGTLIDGTKFDSSYDRGSPATFAPNQVIKGWTEALQLMCEGDKWELSIPFELAYGERGRPPKIPQFSPLVFDVELMQVRSGGKPCDRGALEKALGVTYDEM